MNTQINTNFIAWYMGLKRHGSCPKEQPIRTYNWNKEWYLSLRVPKVMPPPTIPQKVIIYFKNIAFIYYLKTNIYIKKIENEIMENYGFFPAPKQKMNLEQFRLFIDNELGLTGDNIDIMTAATILSGSIELEQFTPGTIKHFRRLFLTTQIRILSGYEIKVLNSKDEIIYINTIQ